MTGNKRKTKKRVGGSNNKKVSKKSAKKSSKKAVNASKQRSSSRDAASESNAPWVSRLVKFCLLRGALALAVVLLGYTVYLDISIRKKFEGQKWALPAHVYTRPMELYVGQKLNRTLIQEELNELGYRSGAAVTRVGSYAFSVSELAIHQREFRFWDAMRPQQTIRLSIKDDIISEIVIESSQGERHQAAIVRLEPRLFGSVSPLGHEDRTLLKLEDVPQALIDGLIANEDRQFYSHYGINPVGIARAMIRNIRAGRVVQGGSTLTQQLVKNYYLTTAQTYTRKFNEVIMALLLELHYGKGEILQAYLNEVYLSQVGNRAIHGFGLASQYFYGRPLAELELDQLAMLVAINNGPSRYNPVRNPERALKRRNLVLKTMHEQGVIEDQQYHQATAAKLAISPTAVRAANLSYPSFMGFVRENLLDDYQQDDLSHDGLQIYTTLNPRIQQMLESAVRSELAGIEKRKGIQSDSLQVAAVVVRTDNGEVAAMLGDRNAGFSGYNRAIKARRPVGSLLKPFVYLTALEFPEKYSLASIIQDRSITVSQKGSPDWQPQNYDGQTHGEVMLIDALSRSYNLATVRLGMELGVPAVADTVRRVGYHQDFSELPSLLLGAVPMSVLDVAQLYLTLASGGFKTPIKGVRSVLSNDNEPLARYSLDIEQVIEPEFNALINYALQEVVRNGTARSVLNGFRFDFGLAGKTGTTDDYRDSWFAGYSGNYLTVVWVGRDDNKPTGLTGASGAAKLWAKVMQKIPMERLELSYTDDLVTKRIYYSDAVDAPDCVLSRNLPILVESLTLDNIPCADRLQYDPINEDELQHFEPVDSAVPKKRKKKSLWRRIFG